MDIAQKLLDRAYSGKAIDKIAEAAGNEILALRQRVKDLETQLQGGSDDVVHGKDEGLGKHPPVPHA